MNAVHSANENYTIVDGAPGTTADHYWLDRLQCSGNVIRREWLGWKNRSRRYGCNVVSCNEIYALIVPLAMPGRMLLTTVRHE